MSDIFFYLSKLLWFFASPDHLLLLLVLVALVCLSLGWRKLAIALGLPSVLVFAALAFFPIGYLFLSPLEEWSLAQSQLPDNVQGIIVLGGSEEAAISSQYDQPHFNAGAERIMTIPVLRQRYPDTPILFTGGSGSAREQQYKESEVVKHWLNSIGLSTQLYFEGRSRNTFENALYAEDVFDKTEGRYLLVTSAYHMPRSFAVFSAQGWKIQPYAVDYRVDKISASRSLWVNLRELSVAVHEWLGLAVYRLTDRTDTLFPQSN